MSVSTVDSTQDGGRTGDGTGPNGSFTTEPTAGEYTTIPPCIEGEIFKVCLMDKLLNVTSLYFI